MKTRLSFALFAGVLTVLLIVGLLPSLGAAPAATATPTASGTPTYPPSMTPLPATASLTRLALYPTGTMSPTSIPLPATYTSIAGETPQTLDTPTLLPVFTETLILFATMTPSPFGGTATPPVPVAFASGEKLETCYKGPSTTYAEIDTFEAATIVGKDTTGQWWYVVIHKGQGIFINCWVPSDQVTTGGNLFGLLVHQPELPQITDVKIEIPGQPASDADYVETITCEPGADAMLHFTGRIFANGPIQNAGYVWDTDVPAQLSPGRVAVESWDAPAQIDLSLPVPARAGTYFLSLRTTFPMEALGELRFTVRCG